MENHAVETVRLFGGMYSGTIVVVQRGCSTIFLPYGELETSGFPARSDPLTCPRTLKFEVYQRDGISNVFRITPVETSVAVGMPDYYKPPLGLPFHWSHDATGKMQAIVEQYMGNQVNRCEPPSPENFALLITWCVHYINAPCWDHADAYWRELADLRLRAPELKDCNEVFKWAGDCRKIGLDAL